MLAAEMELGGVNLGPQMSLMDGVVTKHIIKIVLVLPSITPLILIQ